MHDSFCSMCVCVCVASCSPPPRLQLCAMRKSCRVASVSCTVLSPVRLLCFSLSRCVLYTGSTVIAPFVTRLFDCGLVCTVSPAARLRPRRWHLEVLLLRHVLRNDAGGGRAQRPTRYSCDCSNTQLSCAHSPRPQQVWHCQVAPRLPPRWCQLVGNLLGGC